LLRDWPLKAIQMIWTGFQRKLHKQTATKKGNEFEKVQCIVLGTEI
jgi:hypothetical protein